MTEGFELEWGRSRVPTRLFGLSNWIDSVSVTQGVKEHGRNRPGRWGALGNTKFDWDIVSLRCQRYLSGDADYEIETDP